MNLSRFREIHWIPVYFAFVLTDHIFVGMKTNDQAKDDRHVPLSFFDR